MAPNLVDPRFTAGAPKRIWTADITDVWNFEGFFTLAVIMDLFSRQVVGWAMDKYMKVELVLETLKMAYWQAPSRDDPSL